MAKGYEVLEMLIPQGGWVITGDDYEGITFIDCEPITKEQYLAGFDAFDEYKANKETLAIAKKNELLDRLGITAEEAALLLA
jgi:hypothetical protein